MLSDLETSCKKYKDDGYNDLILCQNLMNRLIELENKLKDDKSIQNDEQTVILNDITRIRKELIEKINKLNPYETNERS